ncbi:MAG TPA: Hsp20/alpha crystallin family protein, partial [Burkholderiaceae bacterium]|nr:Hsp20/alpha crystallin family protein [Burkholderiaceae bacterium]
MFLVPINRSASGWVRNFDRLFDESFDRFFSGTATAASARSPSLDVAESEQAYTVTIELPGVAKDDVKVSIEGRHVSIEAKSAKGGERKDGDRVLLRERAASSYARSFVLPAELDEARSNAKLEHGVLTLELAKRQATPA